MALETRVMSQPLPAAVAEIDWKLVASAVAVFLGTVITTVWGWFQGRKKSQESKSEAGSAVQIAGAVLQDNTSLRENTQAVKDLRDQVMFLRDTIERRNRTDDELNDTIEELLKRLDRAG